MYIRTMRNRGPPKPSANNKGFYFILKKTKKIMIFKICFCLNSSYERTFCCSTTNASCFQKKKKKKKKKVAPPPAPPAPKGKSKKGLYHTQ